MRGLSIFCLCYARSSRFSRSPKKTFSNLKEYQPLLCLPYEWFVENLSRGGEIFSSLQHISIDYPAEGEDDEIYLNQNALENYILGDGPHPLSEELID